MSKNHDTYTVIAPIKMGRDRYAPGDEIALLPGDAAYLLGARCIVPIVDAAAPAAPVAPAGSTAVKAAGKVRK